MSASSSDPGHSPDEDDEHTVIIGAGNSGIALPVGHAVQEYLIERVVGEGGFSIVYAARDTRLGRQVALKEYMPSDMATRGMGYHVSVRSHRYRGTFEQGLHSFVNEARLLASFDHPSLVKVYRFWEEGGTAYMVMPLYQGPTLKKWLGQIGAAPDEAWLLALLMPMIDALEHLHRDHCYHRDIAPDNILLLPAPAKQAGAAGSAVYPLLLDFGAARRVIGDATQALTVILKAGYAPIEQYAESASMRQGPWTDVYALCAVLYTCITGHAPSPSVSRIVIDDMPPAARAGAGRYSAWFLAAIDAGLAVRPDDRPQSMAALRELFTAPHSEAPLLLPPKPKSARDVRIGPVMTASGSIERDAAVPHDREPSSTTDNAKASSVVLRAALSLLGMALLVAGAWWWLGTGGDEVAVVDKPARTVAQHDAASQPAASEPAAQPAPATSALAQPVVVPAEFSVLAALQGIVDRSDRNIRVMAIADKATLTIGKDLLRFRVSSSEPGYLYVFAGVSDQHRLGLLYPDKGSRNNRIERDQQVLLPPKGSDFVAGGPPGTNHIVSVVSRHKRDFGGAGLLRNADGMQEFDLGQARRQWAAQQAMASASAASPFIGKALCATQPCDESYGAALIQIREEAGRVSARK